MPDAPDVHKEPVTACVLTPDEGARKQIRQRKTPRPRIVGKLPYLSRRAREQQENSRIHRSIDGRTCRDWTDSH
jgi:hypothetical protein